MNLTDRLKKLALNLIPTQTRVIVRGHQQPAALGHTMDVDGLHGLLRAAEQGYPDRLFGLYRDILASHAHTQAEFSKRKLAVLGQPFTLTSADPENAAQVAHTRAVQDHLTDLPGWQRAMSHALDSSLYPVSLLERWYAPSGRAGWRYELGGIRGVPHLHLAWPFGEFSIRQTDAEGNFLGTYAKPDPRLHFSHQGNLLASVPEWWGGPMRAILFWWLFSVMDRDWWARFLDRFGSPFLQGSYDPNDERGRYELEGAFSAATKLFGIVVSNETDVKLHQANATQGGDAFEKFHATANQEISKLIVGQTLSAQGQNLGLGGGQAAVQAEVREDIRQFDATCLAATLRSHVLLPLWRLNGWTMPLPTVSWGAMASEEAEVNGQLLAALYAAGIVPTDEGLAVVSRRLGYGLQRIAAPPAPGTRVALSAVPTEPARVTLLPAVAARAARQAQARGAVDALVRQATPELAKLMQARAADYTAAILSSATPEEAAQAIADLTASAEPGAAEELIANVLSSAAVNAAVAS